MIVEMNKDQQKFFIICAVVIAVAVVTLGIHFLGSRGPGGGGEGWQCLSCGYTFDNKNILEPSPIECPRCKGEAVALGYRTCPKCKNRALVSRSRLTAEGIARYQQLKAQGQDPTQMQMGMAIQVLPQEFQWWVKQSSGNYGWTDWIPANSPEERQIKAELKCPKCDAYLYPYLQR